MQDKHSFSGFRLRRKVRLSQQLEQDDEMQSLVKDDSSLEDALLERNTNSSTSNRHWRKRKLVIARIVWAISVILLVLLVVKTHIKMRTINNIDDHSPQSQLLDNKKLHFLDNSPLTRAQEILQIARFAAVTNYSYCGGTESGGQTQTSLLATAHQFDKVKPWLKQAKASYYFHTIAILFQAHDSNNEPRTMGGDEFVVTLSACSHSKNAFKTAVSTRDMSNGTYAAILSVPTTILPLESLNLTLSHYYTCFQGMTRVGPSKKTSNYYYELDMGPMPMSLHPSIKHFLQKEEEGHWNTTASAHQMMIPSLPMCDASQTGIDQLTNGIWMDGSQDFLNKCSLTAKWVSTRCRPPPVERTAGSSHRFVVNKTTVFDAYRVGDSTMPPPGLNSAGKWNIGDPFMPTYPGVRTGHHDVYIDILHTLQKGRKRDVLAFSHGLHQLLHKLNVDKASDAVVRMLCQMATLFRGKIILIGPVPIQQQLFPPEIDITDMNVQLVNAILRQRIHNAKGRLADVCRDAKLDVLYHAPDQDGNFLPEKAAARIFKRRHNCKASRNETELISYFQGLSVDDRQAILANRTVVFADIDDFLRARPECYRPRDKIHDDFLVAGKRDYGYLMSRGHNRMVLELMALRAKMGP